MESLSCALILQGPTTAMEAVAPCLVVIAVLVLIAVWINKEREKAFQARKEAWEAYQNCLVRLREEPFNADLRHQALNLGRTYSTLTRNKKGITVYDEDAVMADINAAGAAGASTIEQPD
jgi:hypothetical protein